MYNDDQLVFRFNYNLVCMIDYQFLHAPRARVLYGHAHSYACAPHPAVLCQYSTVHHTHYLKAATQSPLVEDYVTLSYGSKM